MWLCFTHATQPATEVMSTVAGAGAGAGAWSSIEIGTRPSTVDSRQPVRLAIAASFLWHAAFAFSTRFLTPKSGQRMQLNFCAKYNTASQRHGGHVRRMPLAAVPQSLPETLICAVPHVSPVVASSKLASAADKPNLQKTQRENPHPHWTVACHNHTIHVGCHSLRKCFLQMDYGKKYEIPEI